MQIISKSEGLNERQLFQLTQGGASCKVKESEGRTFDIVDYVYYIDKDKKTKEDREMLVMVTADGDSIATNSATVITSFLAMLDVFPLPIADVQIVKDTNQKSGREFFNIILA